MTAQEVRAATCHGSLIELLKELNKDKNWREIFGRPSIRLKDQELILRFFALYLEKVKYKRPINEFLNKFASRRRNAPIKFLEVCRERFTSTIAVAFDALGAKAFRPIGTLNAAVFDSVMVGIAKRLEQGPIKKPSKLADAYAKLLDKQTYKDATSSATSDEKNV